MRKVWDANFEYAYNNRGVRNAHLIVFEPGTRVVARVYTLHNERYWKCMKCLTSKPKKVTRAVFSGADLYVPIASQHNCTPEKYEDIQKIHDKLVEKFGNITVSG